MRIHADTDPKTIVSEPESELVEPKLFETWSRNRSRNYILNKYLLQSVWRMLELKKTHFYLHWYCTGSNGTVIE